MNGTVSIAYMYCTNLVLYIGVPIVHNACIHIGTGRNSRSCIHNYSMNRSTVCIDRIHCQLIGKFNLPKPTINLGRRRGCRARAPSAACVRTAVARREVVRSQARRCRDDRGTSTHYYTTAVSPSSCRHSTVSIGGRSRAARQQRSCCYCGGARICARRTIICTRVWILSFDPRVGPYWL
eukprot:COSAG02_NODE_19478_length_877_cov_5.580769_1_plen_179_part_01